MAYAGQLAGMTHLEGDKMSVVPDYWVGAFILRTIAGVGESGVFAAAIQFEPPQINVSGSWLIMLIAFHQGVASVLSIAFGLVVGVG